MRRNLGPEDLGDLLTQARLAILATHYRDGTTLLTPVWHEWRDGGFTVVIGAGDVKDRNLRRDPRIGVVVAEDTPPYRGIEVRTEVKFVQTDALATLRRIGARYIGEEAAEGYVSGYDPATAAVIRIEPGKLRAWDFADEVP